MKPPWSTADNSLTWRVWHGTNYLIGAVTYFLGSIILFTFITNNFKDILDTASVSAWLYIIGSVAFIMADITQWIHFIQIDCRFMVFVINFFINILGSLLYLIASICLVPSVNQSDLGMKLFIYGATLMMTSQTWKLIRTHQQSNRPFKQCYNEDPSGFWVDVFAGLEGVAYFAGTLFFLKATKKPQLADWGALMYTLGGLFDLSSAVFLLKRYFSESVEDKGYEHANHDLTN